jgi:V/A-type H+-transporting ATPase subunit I
MSLKMQCLLIIGLKVDRQQIIDSLYWLDCIQLDRFSDLPELSLSPLALDPATQHAQEELGLALMQVKGVIELLGIVESAYHRETQVPGSDDAVAGIAALLPAAQAITGRRKKLQAELDLLPRFEGTLRKLLPLLPRVSRGPDRSLNGLFISKAHIHLLDEIRDQVQHATDGQSDIAVGDVDDSTCAVLIAAPRSYTEQIGRLLNQEDITRLTLPPEFDASSPDTAIAALRWRLSAIPQEMAAIELELKQLADEWAPRLLCWRDALHEQLTRLEVLSHLGQTESTFVLTGWAPTKDVERIKQALSATVGERFLIQEVPLTQETKERAPIELSNPLPARPFEGLIRLFGIPHYGRFDPTSLMAIFLPIFFGLMLGDVGYGALLLVLCLILRFRVKAGMMRDLATILAVGSVWSIVFGFLFGELFGTLGEEIGLHPILFDRASPEHLMDLLILTIGIGAAHVTLGLLIGVWESFRTRNTHHLLERGGRLLGLIAAFLIVGVLVDFLPQGFMTAAIAGLIVGIVLLATSMGRIGFVIAPIEMIGLIGNVLSYLRIAAIGLASVYLARVANEMAGAMGSLVVGIIVAVLLHALNFVLGAFSPTIHSLRLHYVEFFRNFYEGGGRPYLPFGPRSVQSARARQ